MKHDIPRLPASGILAGAGTQATDYRRYSDVSRDAAMVILPKEVRTSMSTTAIFEANKDGEADSSVKFNAPADVLHLSLTAKVLLNRKP